MENLYDFFTLHSYYQGNNHNTRIGLTLQICLLFLFRRKQNRIFPSEDFINSISFSLCLPETTEKISFCYCKQMSVRSENKHILVGLI
jgi:hypothetical protein